MSVTTSQACEGFDPYAGKRWIYPNNMTIRGYQRAAVEKALFNNAMIVLPTGFGKTFIAAVVMYNFYRWYPTGKIIFVAPTRPLVAQQIQECRKISGIPSSDCVELTGSIHSNKRGMIWVEKRVFFATPQVIENDLENSILPARQVKCIVIDEAHRAQGSYSYVNIVQNLHRENKNGFRVLALSATPGSDIQRVQQVMMNLLISEVMFRSENSLDLMAYKNSKVSKAWTVELVGKHKDFVERFIKICDPFVKPLYKAGLLWSMDTIERTSQFLFVQASNKINEVVSGKEKGRLKYLCSVAISLSHNFQLLTLYGIRVFYASVSKALEEPRNILKTALAANMEFDRMLNEMKRMFGDDILPDPNKVVTNVDLFQGHPKLFVVKDMLVKHFDPIRQEEGVVKPETRAIVFTKFRESVFDIVQTMKSLATIRPGAFVGQGSSGKIVMKQKEQLQMVQDFKAGKYNVLVATCVAEEGLDIGEVDLIICYDTSSSAISNTQRRGRTGRKRAGDVQTILTKGYEEKKLKKAGNSRRQVEEQLFNRHNYMTHRYHDAPRMVPPEIIPVCLEQKIVPVIDDEEEVDVKPKRRKSLAQPKKKVKKDDNEEDDDIKKSKKKATKKVAKFESDSDSDREDYLLLEDLDNDSDLDTSMATTTTTATTNENSQLLRPHMFQPSPPKSVNPSQQSRASSSGGFVMATSLHNSQATSSPQISQSFKTEADVTGISTTSCNQRTPEKVAQCDSDIEWEEDLPFDCVSPTSEPKPIIKTERFA